MKRRLYIQHHVARIIYQEAYLLIFIRAQYSYSPRTLIKIRRRTEKSGTVDSIPDRSTKNNLTLVARPKTFHQK